MLKLFLSFYIQFIFSYIIKAQCLKLNALSSKRNTSLHIYICVCSAKNYNAYMDKIRKDKSTMELTVLVYFWVN